MKKTYFYIISILCGLLQTSCMSEDFSAVSGKGQFALSILTTNVETEDMRDARSTTFNVQDFKVFLKDVQGIELIAGKPYGQLSDGDRTLPAKNGYQINVESCSEEEATTANEGWGQIRFVGDTIFNVVSDETTSIDLKCEMVNAGLMVVYDETFTNKFPTCAATTQDARSLVFKTSTADKVAYYKLDATVGSVPLRLTGSAGGWSDRIDIAKDAQITQGKITRLTVKYDENSGDINIEFETDQDMGETSDDVTVQ